MGPPPHKKSDYDYIILTNPLRQPKSEFSVNIHFSNVNSGLVRSQKRTKGPLACAKEVRGIFRLQDSRCGIAAGARNGSSGKPSGRFVLQGIDGIVALDLAHGIHHGEKHNEEHHDRRDDHSRPVQPEVRRADERGGAIHQEGQRNRQRQADEQGRVP